MNGMVCLGVIFLSGILIALLQLSLGTLILLYHSSLGRNVTTKTKKLASSYISGSMLANFLILATTCFLISSLSASGNLSIYVYLILFGLLIILAFLSWFFYHKSEPSTRLWIPRSAARFIESRAKTTSDLAEAFSLGILTVLSEIAFSIVPFVLAADAILKIPALVQSLSLALFTIFSVLPLLILRISLRKGKSVVEIQRWRIKNKTFFRIFTGAGFFILALFILAFVVYGEII